MPHNHFWNLLSKKLSGEALPGDLDELESLLKKYPELTYSAEQVEQLWKLQPHDAGSFDAEIAFQQHLNRLHKKGVGIPGLETTMDPDTLEDHSTSRRIKRIYTPLAVFVVALIAFILFWQNQVRSMDEVMVQSQHFSGEVSTAMGNRTRMVLPDSTIVWLNAGSRLTYNKEFGLTNRNTVLSGEAFFEVKKSSLPFIIKANAVQIKVLGTAFNVKSYSNEKTTETCLLRGKVEITLDKRPGETFVLKPNEKLIVANDIKTTGKEMNRKKEPMVVLSSLTQASDQTIIETSWVNNKLVFQDESFEELAVKMERWYGVEIEFASERIAGERLSGTFTKETIQEALEILQMTTSFRFSLRSNSVIISE